MSQTEFVGNDTWAKWLRLFDFDSDGDLDIVADGKHGNMVGKIIYWQNNNGIFKYVEK